MLHAHFYGRFLIQKDKTAKPSNLPNRNDRSEIEERSRDQHFHFSSSFQTVNMYVVPLVYKNYSRVSSIILFSKFKEAKLYFLL